jgi:hypothetical protein
MLRYDLANRRDIMNKEEQIKFVENFLDEVKNGIVQSKLDIIKDMDKIELSQFIVKVVKSHAFVRR